MPPVSRDQGRTFCEAHCEPNGQLKPRVSLVTVTFNSAETLKDTIASVRAQTYSDIEHILVDGGSTDGTVGLIREAARQANVIIKWTSEPDDGIYDAMNKGIALSSGAIVGILNSDDFFADERVVQDIVDTFDQTRCDALYADLVFVDRQDARTIKRTWIARRGRMKLGWNPPHPTLYLRKSVYEQYGHYRTEYKISSDYDYMLRIFAGSGEVRVAYLDRVIVKMRQGGASTRSLSGNRTGFLEAQRSLKELRIRPALIINVLRVLRKLHQVHLRRRPAMLEDRHGG